MECDRAGEAYGEIGEVAVAGAADAHASNFEHAVDVRDRVDDLSSHSGGSGVKQSVDGAPRQTPAYGDDYSADKESRDWIGEAQPIEMIDATEQD